MDFEETRRQWAEQLMDQASAAYRQEQYPRAIEMLTRALALDPGQSERIEAAQQRISARAGTSGETIATRLSLGW